jgi:outer membrane lipoprotein-sorting protein
MRLCLAVLILFAIPAAAADDLKAVLARIDKAGAAFQGMSAKVTRVSHTDVINEDATDSGVIMLKRPHSHDMRMLVNLTQPDPKTVAFYGHKLEIYYPKINTVQEIDVGKERALVEQFFLIGFGTSKADLEGAYNIRLAGSETLDGKNTTRLELIPKSKEVLQHLKKFELWISPDGYPMRQKFYEPGGDYMLVTYSDMRINPPLSDSELKLHLDKGVKREYPQR